MNRKLDSKKDMNEYKIVIPMSDETIKKIKSNAAKAVLGASIAGVLIAGGQSVKAQSVQEPAAVVQTIDAQSENDKKELSLMIDEILTSKVKKTDLAEVNAANTVEAVNEAKEVTAETMGVDKNVSSDETSNADKGASSDETLVQDDQADATSENNKDITLNDFIKDDALGELFDFNKIKADSEEKLDVEEEKTPEAQKAPTETTEPNYAEDEAKIKDYSEEERYRSTQMEQGNGPTDTSTAPDMESKDGFSYKTLEPSGSSEDKTKWGLEMEFDKEKGQRTYTDFGFTNTGNYERPTILEPDNISANDVGDKISDKGNFKDPNYKASTEIVISGNPRNTIRNLNGFATKEDLERINHIENKNTVIAWEGKYTKDNPNGPKATQGDSAAFIFSVNPWPNENDSLELMKLSGEYNEKVFVQGQVFDTGIRIDNIDDNAKERLVGQVYHPTTGEIVPGASAYIGENGTIHIKMPKGALKKDPTGVKYVVDDESIFSTDAYKGLQNLDVKFFARPRTADEFKAIVEGNGGGFYTETGAGTKKINHDGKEVEVDLQGIDRYDHYNLIGGFKLNLDDTRHYTQIFVDQNNEETDDHKFSKVLPGQDFEVKINNPDADELDETRKTDGEMDKAYQDGQATGKLNDEFLEVANRQIAENLGVDYNEFISNDEYKENRWSIDGSADNISHFKIHAPKNAKAGDFLAVPVEYTYTNGSTDTHWFHFVVQETNNNRPEYLAEVGPQGNVLVNKPIIPKKDQDLKKNQPESYELIGNTFKDNKGNVWNVTIDQTTGAVTATLPTNLPEGKEINGGEKLTVPVKVKYTDKDTKEEKTEEIKAQFIATRQHKTLTNETETSEIPYETEIVYDENLPEGYFQETQAGQKGELKISFVQDTLNGKKGIFQQDGTFKEGESKIVVETVKDATPRIIKIGTKPATTTVDIPFDTEYEVDNNLEAGKTELINDGEKGEVTITTTRNEDGTITVNKETTKEAKNKKIKIGTMTQGEIVDTDKIPFGYKVEFDPDFYTNYPDAKDNYKIVKPGKEGENTKTWTIVNSQKVGDPKIEKTDPVDAVIKVGQKDYNGTVTNTVTKEIPYTVTVVKNPELEAGKSNVKQIGVAGSRTYEYTGEIVNGNLKEGSTFTEKELTDKYVAPKEEIIEIGTKPADNSKTIDSYVEVDVDIIYDPTIDKGVVNIGDLTPGKVTTVVKNVYNPETGEIVTTEETKVSNPSRKVVIGTKDFTSSYTEVDNKVTPYKTEIQFDDTMKEGEQETVQTGVDGVVTTETEVTIVNGVPTKGEPKITKTQEVQNQIIKVGTMTEGKHSHEEKIPFKYEIEYDKNLKAGEYVVDVEGKEGSRITEWTIKNSEVVKDSASVTKEEAPINAKIRVGKKDFTGDVSHEVTEEIPYDVVIEEDPNMIAGTSEIVTQGVAGSKTTKYTQGIKNGEADGELKSEVTAETKATQQVIKVGTKPAENKKDYSKDVNVKVEYEYNSNLDKGVVQVGELTKGKVEIKTVNKYNPKTGEITTTEEETVTEAVQKIIVGTKDFTGTYKYESTTEIPFKVIVKEDPNLAKGQSRVEQEGKAGSKTTYYEIAIKNGEKVGDPTINKEVENDKPLDHIIYVGTAVAKSSTVKDVEREIPYETKVIYDDTLGAGSQVVDNEGKAGKEKVTITTNITDGTGKVSEEVNKISDAENRVVRIGTKPVDKVVEKPFNTEYQYDENLESGKTEEVTPGKNGKVTITTSYDKDQKKLVTSETEEKATNRVVKVGGKTNGTIELLDKVAFEVEVIEDPDMDAGTFKTVQEGIVGEKKTTLTIVNSKEVEGSRSEVITKEPVKKIIKVGTKPNDNMCPVPDPGKPDTEDSDKPGGRPSQPNKPNNPGNDSDIDISGGDNNNQNQPGKPDNEDSSKPNTPDTPSEGGTTNTEEKPSEETKDPEAKPETSVEKEEKNPEISKENNNSVENDDEEDRDAGDKHKNLSKTDKDTKTKQLPKTGDGMNRSLYAYAMGLMGSALLALGAKKKKNDTVDEK